jgi:geranylgeranylglycerol-phosphate geranylgeranyltransferase
MKSSIYKKIKAFVLSIRPETTPLGMLSVYVGGLVAGAAYNSINLILAVISTFFVTSASMTFNDYFDWKIDKINHAERPIPKGIIKPKEMLAFSIIFFSIGIAISFFINFLCFIIALISVLLLVIYEKYSKNIGILSNMTVAFISAISFTYGGASVGNPYDSFILSLMTFFVMTGREIIMDIRDARGDKLTRKSLPIQIGTKKASYVACIFLIITIILSPAPYLMNILNIWYLFIIIPVGIITLIVVIWMLRDIKKAAISAQLIRIALAIALVAFILGINI